GRIVLLVRPAQAEEAGRPRPAGLGATQLKGVTRSDKGARPMTSDNAPSIVRINPPELGAPPGYSQVVEVSASRIIFIAGQTALDAEGKVVGKGDFAAQAAQVFRNLGFALRASGCTAASLVKLTVFLTDMDNLA